MTTKFTTTINLDELENTFPLPKDQLVYREEYDILKQKIIDRINHNKENITEQNRRAVSNRLCYFIDGARGSGKSTILRVLEEDLKNLKGYDCPKIGLLASIDPTEFGETENFFIHILGHVQKLLLQVQKRISFAGNEKNNFKTAYECMQTMSRGLGLLMRNPDNAHHYEDADYLIQESISECVSSSGLKEKFAELSQVLCKILNVDILMVTIDDADMNFIKCKEVMETVRKYLLNPNILFIFAGDLRLFGTVARGMQLNNFGKLMLKYDTDIQYSLYKMVDNLEEQYIMKFFPVDNRMSLRGFADRLKSSIIIKYGKGKAENNMSLCDFLCKCEKLSSLDLNNKCFIDFISIFTMRSVLQLLSYWANYISTDNTREENALAMCRGIRHAVSSALQKYEIDDEISSDRNTLLRHVIQHAKYMKIGTDGAMFLPGFGDATMQMVSFYLSTEICRQIRTIPDILAYVLNVFPFLHAKGVDVKTDEKFFNMLSNHILRSNGAECTKVMLEVYRKGDRLAKPFANGIVPLMSYRAELNGKKTIRYSCSEYFNILVNRVINELTRESLLHFLAVYHSVCLCEVNGKLTFCLSIYNLLNVINSLLSLEKTDSYKTDVKAILSDNKNIQHFQNVDGQIVRKTNYAYGYAQNSSELLCSCMDKLVKNEVFDSLVDEIISERKNLKKHINNPILLHDFWQDFLLRCSEITTKASTNAISFDKIITAGNLFVQYMEAFSSSLKRFFCDEEDNTDNILDNCILWSAWIQKSKRDEDLFQELNKTSIAPINIVLNWRNYEHRFDTKLAQISERMFARFGESVSGLKQRYIQRYKNIWSQIYESWQFVDFSERKDAQTIESILMKELKSIEIRFVHQMLDEIQQLCDNNYKMIKNRVNRESKNYVNTFKEDFLLLYNESDVERLMVESSKRFEFTLNKVIRIEVFDILELEVAEIENNIKKKINECVNELVSKLEINNGVQSRRIITN